MALCACLPLVLNGAAFPQLRFVCNLGVLLDSQIFFKRQEPALAIGDFSHSGGPIDGHIYSSNLTIGLLRCTLHVVAFEDELEAISPKCNSAGSSGHSLLCPRVIVVM